MSAPGNHPQEDYLAELRRLKRGDTTTGEPSPRADNPAGGGLLDELRATHRQTTPEPPAARNQKKPKPPRPKAPRRTPRIRNSRASRRPVAAAASVGALLLTAAVFAFATGREQPSPPSPLSAAPLTLDLEPAVARIQKAEAARTAAKRRADRAAERAENRRKARAENRRRAAKRQRQAPSAADAGSSRVAPAPVVPAPAPVVPAAPAAPPATACNFPPC